MTEQVIGLIDAARLLKRSYAQTLRLLARGDLDGVRGSNGRWNVTRSSVERVRRTLANRATATAT